LRKKIYGVKGEGYVVQEEGKVETSRWTGKQEQGEVLISEWRTGGAWAGKKAIQSAMKSSVLSDQSGV